MENVNALDEVNKGAEMGMQAIHFLLEKVEDKKFKEVLEGEYHKYQKIVDQVSTIYDEYSDKSPHQVNTMEKMMTWYGIEMKTFTDTSNSKIAELLLKGTNMGIIEGRKILNNKNIDKKVNKIIDAFVCMQEDSVEILKAFL